MAAGSWQQAAAQQAEETAARVREALAGGLGLLRAELGLELGLDPHGLPTWLALGLPAALGLGLLGLLLALVCGSGLRRKAAGGRAERKGDEAAALTGSGGGGGGSGGAGGPGKAAGQLGLKGDEQKKRSKKKLPEKAARVRGGAGELGRVRAEGGGCRRGVSAGILSAARGGLEHQRNSI